MEETAPVTPPPVVSPFRLHPFRGLRLTPSAVGDPASARLFARPYRDVPGRLAQWTGSGRVRWDDEPAVYVHEYTAGGVTVRGLVGALDLAPSRSPDLSDPCRPGAVSDPGSGRDDRAAAVRPAVLPHEGVHPEQVSALAERMDEMRVNPAPILLVHRGPSAVRRLVLERVAAEPDLAFSDRNEQVHRLWALRTPEQLTALADGLAGAQVLIADGHHRYAAYLRLAHRHPGTAWTRGLSMLVDQTDTPLWLGAIHRFLAGRRLSDLLARLDAVPSVAPVLLSRGEALEHLGPHSLVLTDTEEWAAVRFTDASQLAVVAFESLLLDRLGIPRRSVSFHHTVDDALQQARYREGVSVLLPSPPFDEVVAAAVRGQLLPEKATSFQPKPSLGVLMRNLTDE